MQIGAYRNDNLPKVRVSEQERLQVEKRAKKLGMKMSDYIRYCVSKEMEGENKNE